MQKVVFIGSGPVAAESLSLLAKHTAIEAIITKSSTRLVMERVLPETPVHTADNRSQLDELCAHNAFESDLAILIDFGVIVSGKVIESFPSGIINSHFSLLPDLRGADPITFAILKGYDKTGVSLMIIDEGMDTGKLIGAKSITIDPGETSPSLTTKLIRLSDELLQDKLPLYTSGQLKPKNQPHPDRATYTRKLNKDDGIIDWQKPAIELEREVRAYIEWPKSRTTIAGREVIITKAHASSNTDHKTPGTISVIDKKIVVSTQQGTLWIDSLKPAGKKEMPSEAFLAGYGHLLK